MASSTEARRIFAPVPSKQDSKANTTTSVARSILDAETKQREAKTARLRELRLKQEAEAPPVEVKPAKKTARKKS
ncbi:hypothetical protein ABMA32_16460 [Mesorhizobium sp. VNQ89]|uniref:hypothetical protein n=1 Tax=Mesorhizobium quangtriensis TaxID=3157709 RepID=UPI0032B78EA1